MPGCKERGHCTGFSTSLTVSVFVIRAYASPLFEMRCSGARAARPNEYAGALHDCGAAGADQPHQHS